MFSDLVLKWPIIVLLPCRQILMQIVATRCEKHSRFWASSELSSRVGNQPYIAAWSVAYTSYLSPPWLKYIRGPNGKNSPLAFITSPWRTLIKTNTPDQLTADKTVWNSEKPVASYLKCVQTGAAVFLFRNGGNATIKYQWFWWYLRVWINVTCFIFRMRLGFNLPRHIAGRSLKFRTLFRANVQKVC